MLVSFLLGNRRHGVLIVRNEAGAGRRAEGVGMGGRGRVSGKTKPRSTANALEWRLQELQVRKLGF